MGMTGKELLENYKKKRQGNNASSEETTETTSTPLTGAQLLGTYNRIKTSIEIDDLLKSEDFEAKSGYVSTVRYPRFGKPEIGDTLYEYINNPTIEDKRLLGGGDADARSFIKDEYRTYSKDNPFAEGESDFEQKGYDFINEKEVSIFNYYYNTEGKDKAQEYLDSLEDTLVQRKAGKEYEALEGNTLKELFYGVVSGADQWRQGTENFGDYLVGGDGFTSSTQYVSGMVRDDLADDGFTILGSSVGQMGYDLINTTTNMLPSILVGAVTAPVGGIATMGVSVIGNAYTEMRRLGYDENQSRTYATLVGAAEAGLQYVLGGISKLGGKVSGKAISNLVSKFDNALAKAAITLGGNMASEGLEEGIQTVLESAFKAIATGEDFEAPEWEEVFYSTLLGALSAGTLDGMSTIQNTASNIASDIQAKELYGDSIQDLLVEAVDIGGEAANVADKYLAKYEKKGTLSGANINAIVNANEQTLMSQDIAKIKSAVEAKLTEYGETGDVSAIADILVKRALGEQLTSKEVNILNKSKAGHQVSGELNEKNLRSGALANDWAADIGTERINTDVYNRDLYELAKQKAGIVEEVKQASVAKALDESGGVEEAQITVSDNGKNMYYDAEAKEYVDADITRVVSTKGGIEVELENGKTVKASDIEYASMEEGVVYEMLARMDVTPETANEIINTFKPSNTEQASLYYDSIPLAYRMGLMNNEQGLKYINLTDAQKRIVYNRGRMDAITNAKERDSARATSPKKATAEASKTGKNGIIFEDGAKYDEATANDLQKAGMAGAEAIAKTTNLEVHVFESFMKDGKRVAYVNGKLTSAPNGYFTDGNKIYIDINAGMNAEGAMLYALSHEVTHYIRKWNAQGFKDLADFLFAEYGKHGVDVTGLIERQKDKIKKRYNEENRTLPSESKLFDMAYEELVADAMSDMLADPNAYKKLEKFKKKNFKAWKKLGEVIKQLLDKLKNALGIYRKNSPVAEEALHVRDFSLEAYNKLQDLYIKAFVEADNNYSSVENTLAESGIAVNPDTDSASLLSVRDVLNEEQRKKVASALATRFGVTKEEAMDWLKAETSMASLILNPKYSQYLDYTPDPNEVAIKQNSDYPQGTVDFSPICAKRREFTSVMNNILRLFPNHVFAATDLAKIRTIMQEEGMTIPCGICYVEDRRQLDTIVAQNFIDSLKLYRKGSKIRPDGKPFNTNQLKGLSLIDGDSYIPSVYELVSLEGLNVLKEKNPNMAEAWVKFNNARGMQSVRLLANEAEYKRQILKYTKQTVKAKNDKGGLRVYSFSDAEMFHLIDIIQVITDSATVGLSLQGYTKVNEYARAVKDTGEKLNRSLIPKGELGYHIEDGKVILDYDTVEGIDINHPDFFDNKDNPNVGNITIGVSDVQIRAAMVSDFVDQIIPFHTGQSEEVLGEKGISTWFNYKDFQTEKDIATGKVSDHQINIYTEVLQVLEKEGKPITKRTFVEKFLQVCKDNGLTPRFSQFLNTNEDGEYVYTEGYHKMLVDFKTFAQTEVGEYLPQMPVKPIFDNEYITKILKDYVKSQKVKDAELTKSMPKVVERITNEIVKPGDSEVKFSDRNPREVTESDVRDVLDNIESYAKDSYFPVRINTPKALIDAAKKRGDIIENLPVVMQVKKAQQAMSDEAPRSSIERAHGLSSDDMIAILRAMDNPTYIVYQENGRYAEVVRFETEGKKRAIAILEIGENKNAIHMNGYEGGLYQILVTAFVPDNYQYIKDILNNKKNIILPIEKKKDFSQRSSGSYVPSLLNESPFFEESISQNPNSVKREFVDNDAKYSIREEAPPKETKKAYKLMRLVDGKLYPLFIGNNEEVSVGTWYNADSPNLSQLKNLSPGTHLVDMKTGEAMTWDEYAEKHVPLKNGKPARSKPNVEDIHWANDNGYRFMHIEEKAGGKSEGTMLRKYGDTRAYYNWGVNGSSKTESGEGSASLYALRPGWHFGEVPSMHQIGYGGEDGETVRLDNQVWVEVEMSADVDYNAEAEANWSGDIPTHIPINGYYRYATNPTQKKTKGGNTENDATKADWYVAGAFKVNRILSDYEADAIVENYNKSTGRNVPLDYRRNYGRVFNAETMRVEDAPKKTDVKYSGREIAPITEADYKDLEKHFGTTGNFKVAGYLLTNGKLLDFSGKHWGNTTSRTRQVDHRDVAEVLDRGNNGINDMVDMIGNGNIRLMPEVGGINLAVYPNEKQRRVLSLYIKQMLATEGQVIIDYDEVGGDTVHSRVYEKYASSAQILSDIRNYFNGARQSDIMSFHTMYSDRDTDAVSNRTLLANALESVAQNDIEKAKLAQYKQKIALIEAEQKKLNNLKARANSLRFTKGRTSAETKQMRDLDFEATQTANRINTYDKQLLNLEATSALKHVLEREKANLRKRLEQKGREAIKAQKEKNAKTVREIMTRNTESRKAAVEGRHKTEMRHKIKNVVSDLNKLLLNPTKEQHVPIGLQGVVADALDAINMDTMNAEERVKYYNDLIAKSNNPDAIKEYTKKRDFFEYRDMNFKERITALKNAYAEFKESDDPLIRNAHNDAIADLISNTASAVGNKSLKDMSFGQLEAVYDMYKAVLATVRNANKMFKEGRQETVTENSEAVKVEVKEVGGHQDRVLKVTKPLKKAGWNMLKPVTAMKVIGSKTLASLFDNVRAAEDTWAVDVNEAKEFYKAVSDKYGYDKWDFKAQHSFKDGSGEEFSISLEQILSLYAYSKRDQADEHLEFGGFIFDDAIEVTEKNKLGIPVKYEVNDANPHRLGKIQIMEITGKLTQEQRAFVDEMQTYLSDVMGAKGNEVSLALYDIKLYKEKNYFPLKTARYFREFDPEKSGTPKIKNSGFSKKTVPQAGNPIVLSNFMDVWASHVNDMSMYHAFVLPLEDFMRVYNYSSTAGGYDSVQQYIKNAYGSQANQYIERLMDDLNGGARVDSSADPINRGISLFKKASVFASASVVVQQPSAIARAFAYINPKYFTTSTGSALNLKKHKEVWAEVKKYAPVAVIKEMGYFDTGMGRSTVEWIKGNKTIKDKMDDALSKAPAMADELSWSYIWLAVKNEIKATTNLTPGSEEFLNKVGERFTEIVTNTQVYDSVLSRSGMMRSKDTGMKMATAFMAEPTTTVNMMIDGILQGKRGNKKFLASTVGAVSASIILNSILVALVYAARDDDEDETYTEKYVGSLTTELVDGFNPLTYIPFVKDIWSIAQGYDVERSDMSVVSNLWESIEGLFNENKSGWEKVTDATGAVSSLFGIPLKNILRDAKGMYNLTETLLSGTPTTGAGISESIGDAVTSSIPLWDRLHDSDSNADKLYKAMVSGNKNQIDRIKSRYANEQAFESAMRQALRDNDSRIKEAAQARYEGDIAEYTRIAKEIIREGNFSQDIVVGAINAEMNAIKRGETTEEVATEDKDEVTSIYSGSDINSAFDNGDYALGQQIISELIETKVANGMIENNAKSSIRSSMTSYWKPLYKEAYRSGDTNEMARIRQILYSSGLYGKANDVVKTTQGWLRD